MRIPTVFLLGSVLPLLAACTDVGAPSRAGEPTAQGRLMQRMLTDINQIRAFVYGGGGRASAENAAGDLVSRSQEMAALFPPGQASADYVDMSPERVRAAPGAMNRTAESLLAAVRSGDRTTVGHRLAQAERDGCGVCHLSGSR